MESTEYFKHFQQISRSTRLFPVRKSFQLHILFIRLFVLKNLPARFKIHNFYFETFFCTFLNNFAFLSASTLRLRIHVRVRFATFILKFELMQRKKWNTVSFHFSKTNLSLVHIFARH